MRKWNNVNISSMYLEMFKKLRLKLGIEAQSHKCSSKFGFRHSCRFSKQGGLGNVFKVTDLVMDI